MCKIKLKNYKDYVLDYKYSLKECLNRLNSLEKKIIFVCKKNKIMGSITDGDIRRALLKNINLEQNLEHIANKNFIYCFEGEKLSLINEKFNKYNIEYLPILNKRFQLVKIIGKNFQIDEHPIKEIPIIIMAGGEGRRLMPHTQNTPKPLLPIFGKPIIEHIINNFKKQGYFDFVISINYLGSKIVKYLGDGRKLAVNISYITEDKNLGTAGAIVTYSKNTPHKHLIVINGDILSNINLNEFYKFHLLKKSSATMACKHYKIQNPYGAVIQNNFLIKSIEEKPIYESFVNAGVYILKTNHLKKLKDNQYIDMTQYFDLLINKKIKTYIFPIFEDWKELGSLEEYKKYT